jgi:lipopolysaccharide/colanic/teichoic acid biosynthesis glycosyltransferase
MSGFVERLAETGRAGEDVVRRAHPVGGKGKRAVDLAVSLAALVALWPLFLMIVLVMKATDPGPVFFAHERIGFNGRRFRCLKFRSMVVESDAALQALLRRDPEAAREWYETQKLRQDPRITTLGRLLRVTSLDELPQLINVLVGDMSIVGPRPIVLAEKARYGHNYSLYTAARPGLTGPWQVSGRSDCSYEQRVMLDVDYVQNWSMVRDALVMVKTAVVVLSRNGSY